MKAHLFNHYEIHVEGGSHFSFHFTHGWGVQHYFHTPWNFQLLCTEHRKHSHRSVCDWRREHL